MSADTIYIASRLAHGDTELLRERTFTRWMGRDLMQAATDFCKNLGLLSLYSETNPAGFTRYLFWNAPTGTPFEIRSGRTFERFQEYDRANLARGWPLLSLHISQANHYSAVWIGPDQYATAAAILAQYGITPAERRLQQLPS